MRRVGTFVFTFFATTSASCRPRLQTSSYTFRKALKLRMSAPAEAVRSCVVAVDIDEVLALFIPALADFHNEVYGTQLAPTSFVSYEFHKVWGGSVEDCSVKMAAFFESTHFSERIEPVPGALDALKWLKEQIQGIELHIVTARQFKVQEQTKEWVSRHFPGIFADIHFGNHYTTVGKSRSKPEMCQAISASCLVDDSPVYATQCAIAGIPVVLFGDYAWNRELTDVGDKVSFISRVSDWHSASRRVLQLLHGGASLSPSSPPSSITITSADTMKAPSTVEIRATRSRYLLSKAPSAESLADSPGNLSLIAAIQMTSTSNKQANLEKTKLFVGQAAMEGAKFICLPECSAFVGLSGAETSAAGETIDGPYLTALAELARQHRVWLSVGGFPLYSSSVDGDASNAAESARETESVDVNVIKNKVRNEHIIFDPTGQIRGQYSKIHLFDSPMAGLFESKCTSPGDSLVAVDVDELNCKIGLSVCYDLRFPELFGSLSRTPEAGGLGAHVILVPAAFTVPTGVAHWEILLRARAIENQVFVVAAAQAGRHNEKRTSYGNTMIIDPWGHILCRCDEGSEGFCLAPLNLDLLTKTREKMPVHQHRRPDVYR